MSKVYDYHIDRQKSCEHKNTFYQPAEPDINVHEFLMCDDCGADLDLPQEGDDLWVLLVLYLGAG
mgnify:CR=1 FL=1